MDKYEARRQALKRLIGKIGRGGISKVAAAIERDASYVSRMLYEPGKDGRKRIGDDMLDVLNQSFPGWLEKNGADTAVLTSDRPADGPSDDDEIYGRLFALQATVLTLIRAIPDYPNLAAVLTEELGRATEAMARAKMSNAALSAFDEQAKSIRLTADIHHSRRS